MLLNSNSIIKIYAEDLFAKDKIQLRYILITALSDIHIICDMWTLPNYLKLLTVIKYFISKKGELVTITLKLKEL